MEMIELIEDLDGVPLCTEEIYILNLLCDPTNRYSCIIYDDRECIYTLGSEILKDVFVKSLHRRGLVSFRVGNHPINFGGNYLIPNSGEFQKYEQLTELRAQIALGVKYA